MNFKENELPGHVKYKFHFTSNFKPENFNNIKNIIAISNCYANYKTLGVVYSHEIMKIIYDFEETFPLVNINFTLDRLKDADEQQANSIPEVEFYRTAKYSFAQARVNFKFIDFVKSSNNFHISSNNNDKSQDIIHTTHITQQPTTDSIKQDESQKNEFINYNEAIKSEIYRDSLEKFREAYIQTKIVEASILSPKKILLNVAEKTNQNVQFKFEKEIDNEISCQIILNKIIILGKTRHINKKLAKIQTIKNIHLNLIDGIDLTKYFTATPLCCPPELDSDADSDPPPGTEFYDLPAMNNFYLRNNRMVSNPAGILLESFQFFKLNMSFSEIDNRMHLLVNGNSLASIDHFMDNATTKSQLAQFVLRHLQKTKWTVMRNTLYINGNIESANIDKSEMYEKNLIDPTKINSNSNIGGKLMIKMGWSEESGLGRTGDGIKEPIINEMNMKRNGLGFDLGSSTDMRSFCNNVKKVLKEWIAAQDDDLIFDRQFDNKERAMIHKECRKLGLSSKSYNNVNGERFLVVTINRDPENLFHWIQSRGGKTKLYTLMPPGTWVSDL